MRSKKIFSTTIITIVIVLISMASFTFYVDPYQQYRLSDKFVEDQRLLNPGLAKNSTYDAVITGSSMSMNIIPSQVDSLFGWNSINLTIMGATINDYKKLFEVIQKENKAKNVIMTLDFFSFTRPEIPLEEYLYDYKRYNDFKYLINYKTIIDAISTFELKIKNKNEIYHFSSPLDKNNVIDEYIQSIPKTKLQTTVSYETMYSKFKTNFLPIINNNQHTKFHIYFPPYSILQFKQFAINRELEEILKFKTKIVQVLLKCQNVKLYDFQCMKQFTMNLNDYMDLSHHSTSTNRTIITLISKDSCLMTDSNYSSKIEMLKSQVDSYVIPK